MNSFKDFNITPSIKSFEGDKIKIDRILNRTITVEAFKIEGSKYEKGNGKCLHLQITIEGSKRVVFTGSTNLMDMIEKVPENGFPFNTTVLRENERLVFT